MNQFPALERLRPYLRIELAVLAAVLVFAVVWFYQNQQVGDAREEESVLDRQLKAAQDDLNLFIANNEQPALAEELRQLQVVERPLSLSSREDALKFRDDVLSYVDDRQLTLNAFGKEETSIPFGGDDFPTIRYSISAQGSEDDLVGMLQLLQDFPTATVQVLQLVRSPESLDSWEMNLNLDVLYRNEGT